MKQWAIKYDIVTRGLVVLSAFVLWIIVMGIENPEKTVDYSSVPVTFVGEESIYNGYSLSIIEGKDVSVSVDITGTSDILVNISSAQIKVEVDVSGITSAGEYNLPYTVTLPNSSVKLASKSPNYINVVVDKVVSKNISVYAVVSGEASDGYYYDVPIVKQSSVIITGPQEEISNISHALITITADKITGDISGDYEYKLIGYNNSEYVSSNISKQESVVSALLTVKKYKSVPFTANVIDFMLDDDIDAYVEFIPESIEIYGTPENVDAVEEIDLGNISINNSVNGDIITVEIPFPDGIKAYVQGTTTTDVKVVFKDFQEDLIGLSNFELNIYSELEEELRPEVQILTSKLYVRVQGTEESLDMINDDTVIIRANIDLDNLDIGVHEIEVELTLASNVMLMDTYYIEIEVYDPILEEDEIGEDDK